MNRRWGQLAHESLPSQRIEHVAAAMITLARWITGRDVTLTAARFRHPQPGYAAEYERVFGCPARFEQPANELHVEASTLHTPIVLPNSDLLETLERLLEAKARLLENGGGYLETVRREIDACMERGEATLEAVASRLAVTPRTLQRRLSDHDTSFREVLDKFRSDLATRYLSDSQMTIDEVAYLLGFSESSAFHRAFRRWTATAPTGYRRHAQAG